MKRNGFTLAELLGVIVIIGLLLLLIIPLIINGVKNRENEVSEMQNQIIFEAVGEYMDADKEKYPNHPGNVYCITIKELKETGKLTEDVKNIVEGKDYDDNYTIEVRISNNGVRKYSANKENCANYKDKEIRIIVSPSNEKWSTKKTATISYPDLGEGYTYQYKIDDGNWITTNKDGITLDFDKDAKIEAKMTGPSDVTKKGKIEKIDTVNPIIKSVKKGSWVYTNNEAKQQISIELTDAHSGVGGYCIKTNTTKPDKNDSCFKTVRFPAYGGTGTVNVELPLGTYYIFAKDRVGNVSDYDPNNKNLTFKVEDTIPPTISLSQNTNTTWTNAGREITLTIEDKESGLKSNQKVYYAWSTSSTTPPSSYTSYVTTTNAVGAKSTTVKIPASASSSLNGTYYLWIKQGTVSDIVGNLSAQVKSGQFKFDNTKPTCNIDTEEYPYNWGEWYNGNVNINLYYDDKESGVNAGDYILTTSSTQPTNFNGTNRITLKTDTNGTTYYGYVKDKAGNVGKCQKTIKRDTTPPTCSTSESGTSGKNGWHVGPVTAKLTDKSDNGSGVASYGMSHSSIPTYNGYTQLIQNDDSNDFRFYGYVKDNAGNETTCGGNISYKKDSTPPTCGIETEGGIHGVAYNDKCEAIHYETNKWFKGNNKNGDIDGTDPADDVKILLNFNDGGPSGINNNITKLSGPIGNRISNTEIILSTYKHDTPEEGAEFSGHVEDNAGNSCDDVKTIYRDTVAPVTKGNGTNCIANKPPSFKPTPNQTWFYGLPYFDQTYSNLGGEHGSRVAFSVIIYIENGLPQTDCFINLNPSKGDTVMDVIAATDDQTVTFYALTVCDVADNCRVVTPPEGSYTKPATCP